MSVWTVWSIILISLLMNFKVNSLMQDWKNENICGAKGYLCGKYGIICAVVYLVCFLLILFCTDISGAYLQAADFIVSLVVIAAVDVKRHIIPNPTLVFMLLSQALCAFCIAESGIGLLNAFAAAVLLLGLFLINKLSKDQLGMGDVKLLAVVGLLYGLSYVIYTLIFSLLLMLLCSVLPLMMKKIKLKSQLPFAPFYTAGVLGYTLLNLLN